MTQKHTPIPWACTVAQETIAFGTLSRVWAVVNAQGQEIARTTQVLPYGEAEGNARLIVQAVNAHEALLAALQEIADSPFSWTQQLAQRAIGKATGPQAR